MNIVRISRLLKQGALLAAVLGSGFILTACGGSDSKKSTSSSSSSSSSNSHSFSSTPVTQPGSGTWPEVKVSASGTKSLRFEWSAAPGATYYKLFKKADANSNFVQVGSDFTNTSTSDAVSVHLTDWVNSRYKVQACSDAGCVDSSPIVIDSAMTSAITYMKSSNSDADDWFGWSLSLSGDGNTMAVGAPNEASKAVGVNGDQNNNESPTSGAVYVFIKVNGQWQQQAYLKASNTEQPATDSTDSLPNAKFGYQVALSSDGNTLAVSAINEDSYQVNVNCDPIYQTVTTSISSNSSRSAGTYTAHADLNTGAVYVFTRANNGWTQHSYIKPSFINLSGNTDLHFGSVIALSGDGKTLAIGDVSNSDRINGITTSASASSNSSQSSKFCFAPASSDSSSSSSSSSSTSSSTSSSSTSSSSNSSSSSSSVPGGSNSGAVYIYELSEADGWVMKAQLKASNAETNDYFGISLSFSEDGNLIAVGAPGEDSTDSSDSNASINASDDSNVTAPLDTGAVYVFERQNGVWAEQAKVKPLHNEWNQSFGTAVAISGDGSTLAIGTPLDYSQSSGVNSDPLDYTLIFKKAISYVSGYVIAYPSPTSDSSTPTGAVYVFVKSSSWTQQAYLKASNTTPNLQFGSALSLSLNGDVLVVGTSAESSRAVGINGDDLDKGASTSGAAYAFTRTGNTWKQKSYIKAPNTNANDRFAHAVGLDWLGETLAVGAHRESSKAKGINGDESDNTASASGAVFLY